MTSVRDDFACLARAAGFTVLFYAPRNALQNTRQPGFAA
jgi:hypothetical protein